MRGLAVLVRLMKPCALSPQICRFDIANHVVTCSQLSIIFPVKTSSISLEYHGQGFWMELSQSTRGMKGGTTCPLEDKSLAPSISLVSTPILLS